MERVEGPDGEDVESCPTIDESLGDEHVADGRRAKEWEGTGGRHALELVG